MEDTPGGILVCPGEASEGLNLQAASLMINLDLPWNPMKLEQRIGRIQRIGGKKDVLIVNLVLLGTIEEKIFEICDRRIQMFEAIVGHVEEILGNLEEDIEVLIRDFYLDRQSINDQGDAISAEENLTRSIDDAEKKSSKPAEESLSYIYGAADFDPLTAEENE
jgi:superfamily II DNA/RNA helicase